MVDGFPPIQGRHPYQRGFAALFEMHRQVGDQDRRRHEHGFGRFQQLIAQDGAFNLDNIKTRLFQGDTHHLKLPFALDFGQDKFLGPLLSIKERLFP